jgi:predicted HD phosphohydrolase
MLTRPRSLVKAGIAAVLARRGYEMRPVGPPEPDDVERARFEEQALHITLLHRAQTKDTVARLRHKYETPLYGRVETWSLIERLGRCVDPTDVRLGGVSQHLHVLQVLAAMEADGVTDHVLLLTALVHDIGKVLLVAGERPENVVCFNDPIGEYEPGIGLDQCVMQWNHDEFAHSRLRDHVPDAVAWLIRYHSIRLKPCEPLMDARDRAYTERYLRRFQHYDQESKSMYVLPQTRIEDYRTLFEKYLPRQMTF